jgi:tetratricopeptide (TPR) repeat protein
LTRYKAGHADQAQLRYQQAVDLLQRSLAKDPTHVQHHRRLAHIHFQRGSCYHQTGQRKEAIAAYRAVVEQFDHLLAQIPNEEIPWWVRSSCKRIGNLERELALVPREWHVNEMALQEQYSTR